MSDNKSKVETISVVSSAPIDLLLRFTEGAIRLPGLVGHWAAMGMRHVVSKDIPAAPFRKWLEDHSDSDLVRNGSIREATGEDENDPHQVLMPQPDGSYLTLKEQQDREEAEQNPPSEDELPPTWPAPEAKDGETPPAAQSNPGSIASPTNPGVNAGGFKALDINDPATADATPAQSPDAAAKPPPPPVSAADQSNNDQSKVDALDSKVQAQLEKGK